MSTPHDWPAVWTPGQVRPRSTVRCTPPLDQLVPNATVLRIRELASPGISEVAVVVCHVNFVAPSTPRQYRPLPELVMPSPTRISALSLSGTTRMSHGLRNRESDHAAQVLPRSTERWSGEGVPPK